MNTSFSALLVAILALGGFAACSSGPTAGERRPEALPPLVVRETPPPGTVTEPWEEPMPDVVDVPAQLDPTGTYYLPAHKQVIEVRSNRYQEVDYGEGDNQGPAQ